MLFLHKPSRGTTPANSLAVIVWLTILSTVASWSSQRTLSFNTVPDRPQSPSRTATTLSAKHPSSTDPETHIDRKDSAGSLSRRSLLFAVLASGATAAGVATPQPADAFANAIPDYAKYADKAKRRGTPPKDLGVLSRTTEGIDETIVSPRLRTCDGNPNCFSTTGDALLEDRQQYGVDFLIPYWKPPDTEAAPIQTIASVMAGYEPGQGGIDGGGFQLVKQTETYLYYQFEALKKGFIDDVEFATSPSGIMVRSASRVGVTDFGVNAVRLNYISGKLRAKGWTIPEITPDTHRDYWVTATEAREATFDEDRRKMNE